MGLVVRLLAAASVLAGTASLVRLFLQNPEGALPVAVMVWCLLILILTVLLVVRSGWPRHDNEKLRRLARPGE